MRAEAVALNGARGQGRVRIGGGQLLLPVPILATVTENIPVDCTQLFRATITHTPGVGLSEACTCSFICMYVMR